VQDYWRLGEASGKTAFDSQGSANGTYTGTVTLGQPGALAGDSDTAAGFDGGGYVSLPALGSSSTFTVEGWTNLTSAAANNSNGNNTLYGAGGTLRLIVRPTGVYAGVWVGGTEYRLQPNTATNVGGWVYWALVRDGSSLTIYRNGTALASTSTLPTTAGSLTGTIGAQNASDYRLHGAIDEVALYNTALPATTLQQHYGLATGG
jgi:hypothetical protein